MVEGNGKLAIDLKKREGKIIASQEKNIVGNDDVQTVEDAVELCINGKSIGQRNNDGYGAFVWSDCTLQKGTNTIETVSKDGKQKDRIVIYL